MREFLWRAVSTFLIVLTVVLAFSSAIISATAKDTETAESNVNTLMTGIDIDLPRAGTSSMSGNDHAIQISIDKNGNYYNLL